MGYEGQNVYWGSTPVEGRGQRMRTGLFSPSF